MVKRTAVIGAGTMGRGIAFATALHGIHVTLQDINEEVLEQSKAYMKEQFDVAVKLGKTTEADATKNLENIHYTTSIEEAAKEADLVIEAVLELMDLKIEIFQKLDEITPRHAILATNTSTMSPTEIAAATTRPDQCVALHFFNPVPKMKLIEVIRGLETSDETMEKALAFGKQIGKECVQINEFPGFATSRMNCLIGNEAMNMGGQVPRILLRYEV